MSKVFLGLPHYSETTTFALPGIVQASKVGHLEKMVIGGGSLLAMGFNKLWCQALNERSELGLTHFAMLHADIAPVPGWIDILLGEMALHNADIISAVVPIKDQRGITSTGVRCPKTGRIRRFTLKEIYNLPVTFAVNHTPFPKEWLMVNTGCWIAKITEPWAEEVCFNIADQIQKDEAGKFKAFALPEDWNFSGWAAKQGLKVMATRAVGLAHHGKAAYGNDSPWGEWEEDKGD